MNAILLSQTIDLATFADKITYGPAKMLDNGGKFINIFYDKKPLIIQTPEMTTPFGMHSWSADATSNEKYSIDLSFKNKEARKSLTAFFNVISALDTKLTNDVLEHSTQWLNKKITSIAVVEALYTPLIKYAKDKNTGEVNNSYPPTFRVSIPYKDNKFQCLIFDNDKEILDITSVETKHAKITSIMKCTGIWVAGGKFGCSWKSAQLRVLPQEDFKGYAFSEGDADELVESDGECDDEEIAHYEKCRANETVAEEEPTSVDDEKTSVESAAVVEEEEAEEEPEEEEAAPKKKTVIRRTKAKN